MRRLWRLGPLLRRLSVSLRIVPVYKSQNNRLYVIDKLLHYCNLLNLGPTQFARLQTADGYMY
jgi:hypothetical protein